MDGQNTQVHKIIEYERLKIAEITENAIFSMYVVTNVFKAVFSTSEGSVVTVKSYLVLISVIKVAT
jgi:hypothetical protein